MLVLTDETLTAIVDRVKNGEGVEAILADMNIDSDIGTAWLKAHPTAKSDIANSKKSNINQRKSNDARRIA